MALAIQIMCVPPPRITRGPIMLACDLRRPARFVSRRKTAGLRSGRRVSRCLVAGKQMYQRALDRRLPRRRADLRTQEIGDIEHVAGTFAEGRDMGRSDVEIEL